MVTIQVSSIFLVFPIVASQICQEGTVDNSDVQHGKALGGDLVPITVFEINARSWIVCARHCLFRSVCKSIVYDSASEMCSGYIVTNGGSFSLISHSTSSYTEAANLPQSIAGPCADHDCGYHQVCVPEGFTSHHCTVIGFCDSPPPNSVSDGTYESGSLVENMKASFRCTGEDMVAQPNTVAAKTSWCFAKQKWTQTTFNCVEGGD